MQLCPSFTKRSDGTSCGPFICRMAKSVVFQKKVHFNLLPEDHHFEGTGAETYPFIAYIRQPLAVCSEIIHSNYFKVK